MHPKLKKVILCRLPYIAENTGNVQKLLVHLLSLGAIEVRERDNILSHPSDYDRCIDLCTTLLEKKDETYVYFKKALEESGNAHVRDEIMKPLTKIEKKRSIDECFYDLNTVMKGSKAERKLHFYQSLKDVVVLRFQQIGVPGKIGWYKVLYNYYVLNPQGERLFRLTWNTDRIYNGFKPMFGCCKVCLDTPEAFTKPLRLAKTIVGDTIMEIDTPASSCDINVGNDFIGSVEGRYIKNAESQVIWRVNRSVQNTPQWNVHDFSQGEEGQLCATFGACLKENSEVGLIFHVYMPSEFKAMLLGAAVVYMDKEVRGSACLRFSRTYAPLYIPIVIPAVIVLIIFVLIL